MVHRGRMWLTGINYRRVMHNPHVRVIRGIVYVIQPVLQWKDTPAACGQYKTLYNRFVLWCRAWVFNVIR